MSANRSHPPHRQQPRHLISTNEIPLSDQVSKILETLCV
jgi:hypothetical protein